jgi:hypothetical protein
VTVPPRTAPSTGGAGPSRSASIACTAPPAVTVSGVDAESPPSPPPVQATTKQSDATAMIATGLACFTVPSSAPPAPGHSGRPERDPTNSMYLASAMRQDAAPMFDTRPDSSFTRGPMAAAQPHAEPPTPVTTTSNSDAATQRPACRERTCRVGRIEVLTHVHRGARPEFFPCFGRGRSRCVRPRKYSI